MKGNFHVRFSGVGRAAMFPCYPVLSVDAGEFRPKSYANDRPWTAPPRR